jgi:hypothetical protein
MKYSYNILFFIILIVLIILFNSFIKKSEKYGFENYNTQPWSKDLIKRFNVYQTTMNKHINHFNLDQLQKQATAQEAEDYLRTGVWSWPDDLKNLYMEKIWESPIIKIDPQIALNYAMGIYNQNAVRELLAWNTKEGHFLLYGADLGVTDGMPKNVHNILKCSTDSVDNSHVEKKVYTGMNLWNGYMNSTTTPINPEDIPNEMPGFSFVNGPCNPCVALNPDGDFSCPFQLNIKGDNSISLPWQQLWNL